MGFLKHFFRAVLRDGTVPAAPSCPEDIGREQLEHHLSVARYGSFELTDAVRPSFDLKVVPEEGFRTDVYRDKTDGFVIPVVMGSVTREKLFDTFIDMLDPLGDMVDVILESSHSRRRSCRREYTREAIDLPVLKSILYDYEDFLVNDGCTGIAVLNTSIPQEVQLDEHKLLITYGEDIMNSQAVFRGHRVPRNDKMHFLTEAEHVHSTRESYQRRFEELRVHLAMD